MERRVDATPDFAAFDTEVVDLDLRYRLGRWTGLAAHCVMRDLVLPLYSLGHLERLRAASADPVEQLASTRLIYSVKTLYRWDLWLASNRIDLPELSYPFLRPSEARAPFVEGRIADAVPPAQLGGTQPHLVLLQNGDDRPLLNLVFRMCLSPSLTTD